MTSDGAGEIPSESPGWDSTGSNAANSASVEATWKWLQSRHDARGHAEDLSKWIEVELATLEDDFDHWITPKSLMREVRSGRQSSLDFEDTSDLEN